MESGVYTQIGRRIPLVRFSDLRQDVLASIVTFLVALPLCMGIAIASGEPPASGILTGIIGGLVVGWIAGCPLQVSGHAGLTVIVVDSSRRMGVNIWGSLFCPPAPSRSARLAATDIGFGQYHPPSSTACWRESGS